ncbi:protein ROOT INITIATION DEFECTIVE 3-like [Phragmites australis]|uniref:protein ROOT INITIATION DEFECTIVE 3-like n=1 Tax=Phragmites australis TaxID=29695 RepID=UPI002D78EE3A|nr:protein ROOT INITIATION DEFECTIVE 3-like [Phragmites australis]
MEREKEAVLVVCDEESDAAPMFDVNTGEEILYINDCLAPPSGIANVSGHLLAASRSNKGQTIFGGAIYFWATNKLQETHTSYIGEAIGPITCSKDGMYLVGGAHSGNAYIWEVASGALLKSWRAHKNAISSLSFSQDSSLVISGSEEGTVHVWCMISLFQAEEPQSHEAIKYCPSFCNTVKHEALVTGILTILGVPCPILITSSLDGSCKVTELMSERLLHMLELSSPITAITIDPLEQLLICGAGDAAIYVTGLDGIGMSYLTFTLSKDDCQVLYGHKAPISALAFSSEGVWLVSGAKDCNVLIWDTTTWNVVRKLENKMGPVTNLLVIPNPVITRVHTRNLLALEIPTLQKIFRQTNETPTFLQPSDFSKDADSTRARFNSSNLLSKQILDLEVKRTPEAIEMIVGMTIDEQIKNQNLAKELGDMNSVLQWKALNVMEVRATLD